MKILNITTENDTQEDTNKFIQDTERSLQRRGMYQQDI